MVYLHTVSFWRSLHPFELPVKSPRLYSGHTVQTKVIVPLKTAVWQAIVRMRNIELGPGYTYRRVCVCVWRYRPVRPRALRFPGFWILFFGHRLELLWMGDRPVASPLHIYRRTQIQKSRRHTYRRMPCAWPEPAIYLRVAGRQYTRGHRVMRQPFLYQHGGVNEMSWKGQVRHVFHVLERTPGTESFFRSRYSAGYKRYPWFYIIRKIHYPFRKNPPLDRILSQMNPETSHALFILVSIVVPCTVLSRIFFPFIFPTRISYMSSECTRFFAGPILLDLILSVPGQKKKMEIIFCRWQHCVHSDFLFSLAVLRKRVQKVFIRDGV